jgi:N-acetylmuramic acid 6-phosphate etherase
MMITESVNPDSLDIDQKDSLGIVQIMNQNDQQVALAVQKVLPEVARAVDLIVEAFQKGGRLFYIGAGTSGRLGIVDAAECPPTYGVDPEQVQGVIAGGYEAIVRAKEFAEDDPRQGWLDLQARGFTAKDVLVGLATSGRTPYTCGALEEARKIGAATIAIFCNPDGRIREFADVSIVPVVGPEVVTGSTRLKAGTAQKMVLNMLSTASMIRTGRVIGNLLVDMKISCEKLQQRAVALLVRLTDASADEAQKALEESGGIIRKALEQLQKR